MTLRRLMRVDDEPHVLQALQRLLKASLRDHIANGSSPPLEQASESFHCSTYSIG